MKDFLNGLGNAAMRFLEGVAKIIGSRKAWVWVAATALLMMGKLSGWEWLVASAAFMGAVSLEKLINK